MARNYAKCPHIENAIQLSLSELCKLKQGLPCSQCNACGPNLWICLHRNCLYIGCSEQANDHSTDHFRISNLHCIHMNLSSQRIWCYLCETEVFLSQRRSSLVSSNDSNNYSQDRHVFGSGDTPETSCDEEDLSDRGIMNGLVGLQNIANTCYMNAALQALSNTPPLTYFFLDCADIIDAISESPSNQRKPGLAKSYQRLIKEMWCRSKRSNAYVVPRGILYGIRSVHPMFRGFQQHDTQEFLRCFMDQLHEELKEVTPPPPDAIIQPEELHDCDEQSDTPSQSEAEEYETCDSGVSEQSSLSDEVSSSANLTIPSKGNIHGSCPSASISAQIFCTSIKSGFNNQTSGTNNSQQQILNIPVNNQKEKSSLKPPHRSIISDIFDGKLLSSVQCLTCDRISTREETFQDLSLPIPGKDHLAVLHTYPQIGPQIPSQSTGGVPTCTDAVYQASQDGWLWWIWNWFRAWFWGPAVSLHDCMAAFFSADELKGDNMYSCEKCNKLRNGIKYSRVLALPEILCVHLKRFRHDLSYSSKISSPVNFPLTGLDMRLYLHKDCKSEISTYDLTAVICHHGTVGGGHYTSFAKHEMTGKWFEFDDQLVTEVSSEVVQSCQAYVLFYRKFNPQMTVIRSQAQELAEISPPQASDIRFFVSRQWINRFNTFAEPGPIDNWSILCPHGGLPPCKAALIGTLAVPLPQVLWDFLYKKFGGGPACNRLFECDICQRAAESISHRQKLELEVFTKLNNDFQYQSPTTIYAISMAWLRSWQLFARGVISTEPGPIDNKTIAGNSESMFQTPIRKIRPGSDYAQLNSGLWYFFHGTYGGGPEIILRGDPVDEHKTVNEKEFESIEIDQEQSKNVNKRDSNEKLETRSATISTVGNQIKQTKNVSFEDEHGEMNDDENEKNKSEDNSTAPPVNTFSGTVRRNRFSNSNHDIVNNIINKKDKKYRSVMKSTSGLFGPEGKYQTQKSEVTSDPQSSKQTHAKNINSAKTVASSTNFTSNSQFQITRIEDQLPVKRLEEAIPLLQQPFQASTTQSLDSDINTMELPQTNMLESLQQKLNTEKVLNVNNKKLSSNNFKNLSASGKRKKYKSKNNRRSVNVSGADQESD